MQKEELGKSTLTARPFSTSIAGIRRLAVTKQHLAGRMPAKATSENILSVIRDLAYVQWDPISVIAPSHMISLWSRVGKFRLSDLDRLLWDEKKLFQHWTPIASIVLTRDYPLFYSLMRRYPESLSGSWRSHEVRGQEVSGRTCRTAKECAERAQERAASIEPIRRLRSN